MSLSRKPSRLRSLFKRSTESDNSNSSTPTLSRASSTSSFISTFEISNYGKKMELLGTGVSGKVELYYKKSSDKLFAIKTFNSRESYESKEEYRNRCAKEFDIIHNLPDPHINILRTFKFISGISVNQIVFEYVPYNFVKVVQSAKPHPEEILCFFRQTCEGIQFLHQNYIAHRDLKMENLMMDEAGVIKIIDFGSAFYFSPEKLYASGLSGTEALTSPESFKKLKYDSEANDVWSLGILFYSMLNLRFPWKKAVESDPDFKEFLKDKNVLKDDYLEYWDLVSNVLTIEVNERIKMDELVNNVSRLTRPHYECLKLHQITLKACARRFASKLN